MNILNAPGPEGLSARVLKECSSEIAPILTLIYMYNESLAQGTVPDEPCLNMRKLVFGVSDQV